LSIYAWKNSTFNVSTLTRTLADWLEYQQALHPQEIELGLTRCRGVAARLNLLKPTALVVSIAGTNGKGSSAALLDAILTAAGYRTGRFSSPHLLRYNERICVTGEAVDDASLCTAFARIESARGDISLTYFEYSTLAALEIFRQAKIDIAILEVGLGGRLDAVNIIDADIALITALDIDHVEWLGCSRAQIALEKAGIFRSGHPAVCADPDPPQTLLDYAQTQGVPLLCAERDFSYREQAQDWTWLGALEQYPHLPRPALAGAYQLRNASGVLQVVSLLRHKHGLDISAPALATGLRELKLPGRWQRLRARIPVFLDVAHNPLGARAVVDNLVAMPHKGSTHVLLGMMKDKDLPGTLEVLRPYVDSWHLCPLYSNRSADVDTLQAVLDDLGVNAVYGYEDVVSAYRHLCASLPEDSRLVVMGSFLTVAAVLESVD
jgi:dihydrofolate synthase / folylpolyglutamate synthase